MAFLLELSCFRVQEIAEQNRAAGRCNRVSHCLPFILSCVFMSPWRQRSHSQAILNDKELKPSKYPKQLPLSQNQGSTGDSFQHFWGLQVALPCLEALQNGTFRALSTRAGGSFEQERKPWMAFISQHQHPRKLK